MNSQIHPADIIENHPIHYTILFDWILKSIPDIFVGLNSQCIKDKHVSLVGVSFKGETERF